MPVPDKPTAESQREHVSALFVQFSSELRGFILSLLPDMARADDVFQETFLTVLRKAGDFQPGTNFIAWACTVARYKVLEAGRVKGGPTQPLSEEVIESLCASCPEPNDQEDREMLLLQDCMSELHPHTRRAMELRYEQGHKPAEIARRLGWSAESVYVVLSRARAVLRECVGRKIQLQGGGGAEA